MSIRIAIIGTGIMGSDHARIIANDISGVKLQVVCDAFEESARKVADIYGVEHVSTDPIETINRDDVDAVLIASPDETHAEFSIAAIKAGKYALSEKPLAQSSDECIEVMKAEEAVGRQMIQVGFMRRFDPAYTEIKAALDKGDIGKAVMMHNYHRNVEAPANFTGQMAITNSAPHEFDVARFVLGTDYKSISVFQPESISTSKVGAPVFMVIETTTGELVNIEINNNATYGYDVRGELIGEKGSMFLNSPVYTRTNLDLKSFERYAADWRARFAEAYRLQAKAWIEFIRSGKPSEIASNSWDGYCAAVVAEAGVESLNHNRKVEIEMIECPALYKK